MYRKVGAGGIPPYLCFRVVFSGVYRIGDLKLYHDQPLRSAPLDSTAPLRWTQPLRSAPLGLNNSQKKRPRVGPCLNSIFQVAG